MTGNTQMTASQMYRELVSRGLVAVSDRSPFFQIPSNYGYMPTRLVYTYISDDHAKLESGSDRSKQASGAWKQTWPIGV